MARAFAFSFYVGLAMAAFAYVYLMTMLVFMDRWLGLDSPLGMLNAAAYTTLAVMFAASYRLAMFTDPGRVPASFVLNSEDAQKSVREIKRKGGNVRFCQKCSQHKPPRTHHCRICNRCVLRMDHHCVWVNNCVGHANHKYLYSLLVYAEVASLYSMVLLLGSLTADYKGDAEMKLFFRATYIISGLLLTYLCLSLAVLLWWNVYLVTRNKTQIEYFEGVRSMCVKKGGPVYSNPYDIGTLRNVKSILGPTVFDWIFPTTRHIGTGLRFPTRYDDHRPPHTPR
ncbi:probable protein S-acyltransferase 16 [Henckelia pumila]|uniref:probable protein S-acyltransferase 16 n=1 Tax=Henckelia pumila TaxID=405737 RepID=UPI003C6DDEC1